MSKVVDFDKSRQRLEPERKEAKAAALRDRFAASRKDAELEDPARGAKATRRLLDLFKKPPPKSR